MCMRFHVLQAWMQNDYHKNRFAFRCISKQPKTHYSTPHQLCEFFPLLHFTADLLNCCTSFYMLTFKVKKMAALLIWNIINSMTVARQYYISVTQLFYPAICVIILRPYDQFNFHFASRGESLSSYYMLFHASSWYTTGGILFCPSVCSYHILQCKLPQRCLWELSWSKLRVNLKIRLVRSMSSVSSFNN